MKNVLITGISRGLGLEVARRFLSDNWNVYGVSRSEPKEISELRASDRFKYHCFDLTNADLIKKTYWTRFFPTISLFIQSFIMQQLLMTRLQPMFN